MDVNREILDKLMGRDRNKSKDEIKNRDHYSNKDVCKSFLICFCFNTLFPNTAYDQGPCKLRHDPFLKSQFDGDMNRSEHQRQYLVECINWIEKRLGDVEARVKKNQALIESKTSYSAQRPKDIVDMLIGIDKEIEDTMRQAEIFGQSGQILQSQRCMNDVQRLRAKKREVESMGDDMMNAQKQQRICEICGAIQTINDTEKRITTHLEGKIHQGFLRLRHEIETLKIRLDILNNLTKKDEKEKVPVPEKQTKKSRSRSHRKKSRSKTNDHPKKDHREKDRDHRDRDKDKNRDKNRDRDHKDRDRHDRSKDRKDKDHKKKHRHDRSRERDGYRDRD